MHRVLMLQLGKPNCFELKELLVVVTCKLLLQAYFDEAGHWLYIEQPEVFNNLVLQFVSKA